ncbi:MAG: tyrosine recombinase XerC [Candidatus Dormibacteria bacterium]
MGAGALTSEIPFSSRYRALAASFRRSQLAQARSPKTIKNYADAISRLEGFLVANGHDADPESITREGVEAFITSLLNTRKPATAANRYRALNVFFNWLVEEEEIERSPMAKMHPPRVVVNPPAVVDVDTQRRLLKVCEGKDFISRRDTAILALLIDTGMRLAEISGLTVDDLDLELNTLTVVGKGNRERHLQFGRRAASAVDRYLRARVTHPAAESPRLWLGHAGPMTSYGLADIVGRRGRQAGLPGLHPHLFRHSFAHAWLASGGQETDLMQLGGWRSRTMLDRYGASAASQRAREAHRRLSPLDAL